MKVKSIPDDAEFIREEFVDNENLIRFYQDNKGRTFTEHFKLVDTERED